MRGILIIIVLFHVSLAIKAQTQNQSDTIPFLESKRIKLSNQERSTIQVNPSIITISDASEPILPKHTLGYVIRRRRAIRDSIIDRNQRRGDSSFFKKYRTTSPRVPEIALGFSLFIPGAGQVYNKQYIAGGCFFVSEVLLVKGVVSSNALANGDDFLHLNRDVEIAEITILAFLHITQLMNASLHAEKINTRLSRIRSGNHLSFHLSPIFLRQERNIGSILPSNSITSSLTPGLSLALRW